MYQWLLPCQKHASVRVSFIHKIFVICPINTSNTHTRVPSVSCPFFLYNELDGRTKISAGLHACARFVAFTASCGEVVIGLILSTSSWLVSVYFIGESHGVSLDCTILLIDVLSTIRPFYNFLVSSGSNLFVFTLNRE